MKKIYLTIKHGRGRRRKGYILDISRHGIGIACNKIIRKGAIIEIKTEKNILLPMRGKVTSHFSRNRKSYRYKLGARFVSLEKEKIQKLESFLHKIDKRNLVRLKLI